MPKADQQTPQDAWGDPKVNVASLVRSVLKPGKTYTVPDVTALISNKLPPHVPARKYMQICRRKGLNGDVPPSIKVLRGTAILAGEAIYKMRYYGQAEIAGVNADGLKEYRLCQGQGDDHP